LSIPTPSGCQPNSRGPRLSSKAGLRKVSGLLGRGSAEGRTLCWPAPRLPRGLPMSCKGKERDRKASSEWRPLGVVGEGHLVELGLEALGEFRALVHVRPGLRVPEHCLELLPAPPLRVVGRPGSVEAFVDVPRRSRGACSWSSPWPRRAARRLVGRAHGAVRAIEERMTAWLSEQERRQLFGLLRRCTQALEVPREEPAAA
jgi:hypothetical protein